MSYDEFWNNSDPYLFWDYSEMHLMKLESKRYYDNTQAWLSGLYIQSAIASLLDKDTKYMEIIDLPEIDRRARLTEEERNAEDHAIAVEISRSRLERLAILTQIEKEQQELENKKKNKRKLSTKGGKIVGKL